MADKPVVTSMEELMEFVNTFYNEKEMGKRYVMVIQGEEDMLTFYESDTCEGRFEGNTMMFEKTEDFVKEMDPFQVIFGKNIIFTCFTKKSIMEEYEKQIKESPNLLYGITGPVGEISDIKL